MHLKISTVKNKEKIAKYAKIVEAYWDKKKNYSRQRIILNLGLIKNENDLKNFKEILAKMNKKNDFVNVKNLELKSAKNYGIYYCTDELFKINNIDKILIKLLNDGRQKYDIYKIIQALIINRLENPLSKKGAFEYIQKDYFLDIDCKLENLYSSLDKLIENKEDIELEIFNNLKMKLNLNLDNAHYDITSSYFEGHKCEIAAYGYSRDHRNDREQIVIGLVLVDGIPIYHEVFEGNTSDKTTVLNVVKTLKKKFKLKNPTIIGDRGMFTKENIESLENNNENYILGFSKVGNKITEEVILKNIEIPKDKQHHAIIAKTEKIELSKNNIQTRNYILCIDKNTKIEQLETLKNIQKYILENLERLKIKFENSQISKRGKKMTYESLVTQVKKIVSRNKKLFDIYWCDKKSEGFTFRLNQDWYNREKIAAGKFIIVTNTNKTPLNVLKTYKELNTVESSFNCIKNQLEIRPINHYKESRVKAHVFICVLALLVEKIMERSLKDMTAEKAIIKLKRLKIGYLTAEKKDIKLLSEIDKDIENILVKLKLKKPILI
jgi:transposase